MSPVKRMSVVESLVEEGKLVAIFGRRMQVPRALHAIYAPGAENRPEARAFVDWLRREIA